MISIGAALKTPVVEALTGETLLQPSDVAGSIRVLAGHTVAETTFPPHRQIWQAVFFLVHRKLSEQMNGMYVAFSTTARWLEPSTFRKTIAYH